MSLDIEEIFLWAYISKDYGSFMSTKYDKKHFLWLNIRGRSLHELQYITNKIKKVSCLKSNAEIET